MRDSNSTIRVAIVGGGLVGATLLRGLIRYPHIAVDMYESRPYFKEERPGIELSQLAQSVLRAIDPHIDTCLDRAGAVYTDTELRIATGPLAGLRLDINDQSNNGKRTVGRQALLTELLAGVPPRMIHLNARVTAISEASPGNGLTLTISDGTQKRYDVVIGADGVQGKTRAYVVGPNDPAQEPKHSGFWSLPLKISLERARQVLGPGILDPNNPRQITWIGDGTSMQLGFLNRGREVQAMAAATFDGRREEFSWAKLFTPEEFAQIFSQNNLEPCRGIVKLAQSVYTIQAAGICEMQHVPTRTYASKNACVMCDAAHGTFSFHGASSSIDMEEALILTTLLGKATSKYDVPAALSAYDEVCRPRAEFVIRATADISLLMTGRAPGIGLDPVLLAKTLGEKWNTIDALDVNSHCVAAVGAMERKLSVGRQW